MSFLDSAFGESGMGVKDEAPKADPVAIDQTQAAPQAAPAAEAAPAAVVEAPEGTIALTEDGKEGVVDEKGHVVPLKTYLDTRDELKAAKERADALQAKLDERTQADTPALERPDPAKDPAGAARYDHGVIELRFLNEKMNNSERFARLEHKETPDLVDKAKAWAIERFPDDQAYEESVMLHADPFAKVVKDYQAEQRKIMLADVDPEDFQRFLEARDKGEPYVPPKRETTPAAASDPVGGSQTPKADKNPVPTRSIAGSGSAGGPGTVKTGDGEAFASVFPK